MVGCPISEEDSRCRRVSSKCWPRPTPVPRLSPPEVRDMIDQGNVLIVDVRDAPELAAGGKIKDAVHVSRGMLEFRADPESPYHDPAFQPDKTVLSIAPRAAARRSAARP